LQGPKEGFYYKTGRVERDGGDAEIGEKEKEPNITRSPQNITS